MPRTRVLAGFRGRLVLATTLVTLVTLGGAFAAVYESVNLSQQRRLDRALLAEARREAAELARAGSPFVISDRPGPSANDAGPLPKHAAVIDRDEIKVATPGFAEVALSLRATMRGLERGFDFWHGGEHLRGVAVAVPHHPGMELLLAVPRIDLDGDAAFLVRAMRLVFLVGVAWTTLVAWVIVRRITRVHQRIARVVHSVAAGNLSTRVAAQIQPGAVSDDLSEMGRDIDDLIDRLAVLVQSQQQFIAHAAHELRSPLTTLYGELSLALRRPRTGEEYHRIVEESLESARRLKLLAEDLLVLARVGTKAVREVEDVPLREVFTEAMAHIRGDADLRNVEVRLPASAPKVSGRKSELVRLFRNLLENAVRHSPEGGVVTVDVSVDGASVTTSVRDQGPGVHPDDRERIFEPFFRAAADRAGEHQGSGLGLPIARHLAGLGGGSVELADDALALVDGGQPASDEAGKGAQFLVRLPAGTRGDLPSAARV